MLVGPTLLVGKDRQAVSAGEFTFLEAEGFADHGGWELDQQSMDQMGSPYLLGDVGLDAKDFMSQREFLDQAFPCSWHVDVHFPKAAFQKGFEGNEFVSDYTRGMDYNYGGLHWAPYRCLYSRNISNLFMVGRDISVTKAGLGAVRVMRTCGMMGEIVGKAAAVCVREKTTPRGVYEKHFAKLQELMKQSGSMRVA